MGPDASLTPELIQAQSFTSTFRGYDQAEVRSFLNRVATEMRAWRERAEQLESAWHSAEERAARPPVLDEDTLMAAVGEETASILRSARAAAADMRAKAAEEAESLIGGARSQAEELLQEARTEADKHRSEAHSESEKLLGEARAESERLMGEAAAQAERARSSAEEAAVRVQAGAEDAAARLMSGARAEAAEILEKSRTEAEATRAAAEKDRQLTIEGAQTTRDRILEDLGRRRRIASVQIEQLRAGRERLIESYAVVRRTLEEVSTELSRADAEARAAADEVGRRMEDEFSSDETGAPPEEPNPVADEAAPAEEAAPVGEEVAPVAEEEAEADEVAPAPEGAPVDEDVTAEDDGVAEADGATEAPEAEVEAPAPAPTPAPSEVQAQAQAEAVPTEEPPAPPDTPARAKRTRSRAKAAPEPEPEPEAAPEPQPQPEPAVGEEPAPEPEQLEAGEATGSAVDELFARIRGNRAGDVVAHQGHQGHQGDRAGTAEEEDGESQLSDADESLLQRREAAVVDLEVTLTRRLKRALQDEQNDVLDRLRNLKGEPDAARLLPDHSAQNARYQDAARPLLEQAGRAGAWFAYETLGLEDTAADTADATDIEDLAGETGTGIVEPLRRRLEQAIARNAGDDQAVLIEALGAAYREWKTQRIERLAGDVLSAAFSRGTWEAVAEGTPLRWIVEDVDGPCPDCDDDALAGELPKGEVFPTGQHHPPAHSGCRCLLVPGPAGG